MPFKKVLSFAISIPQKIHSFSICNETTRKYCSTYVVEFYSFIPWLRSLITICVILDIIIRQLFINHEQMRRMNNFDYFLFSVFTIDCFCGIMRSNVNTTSYYVRKCYLWRMLYMQYLTLLILHLRLCLGGIPNDCKLTKRLSMYFISIICCNWFDGAVKIITFWSIVSI